MSRLRIRRCCPESTRSVCRACAQKLPARLRSNLTQTYDDADLLGHAYATDAALTYLIAHRGGRPKKAATA